MTVQPSSSGPTPQTPSSVDVSFEFFPPKTDKMQETLWAALQRLAPLGPTFASVTYGAGGSTRERTHETVTRIQTELGIPAAAHLTCVAATREEVNAVARSYWDAGIRHIVALRGDPPEGAPRYEPTPGGYAFAVDLVKGLSDVADFEISVAAYPETHPQALSPQADLDNLKAKIDAGATRAISQYFFNIDHWRRFRDRVAAAGITVPIVPGILPVTNFAQVVKFSAACGTEVPKSLADRFEGLDDDPETRKLVAATTAAELCQALLADGEQEFHFYTLNRAELTYAICHMLGVRPTRAPAES